MDNFINVNSEITWKHTRKEDKTIVRKELVPDLIYIYGYAFFLSGMVLLVLCIFRFRFSITNKSNWISFLWLKRGLLKCVTWNKSNTSMHVEVMRRWWVEIWTQAKTFPRESGAVRSSFDTVVVAGPLSSSLPNPMMWFEFGRQSEIWSFKWTRENSGKGRSSLPGP